MDAKKREIREFYKTDTDFKQISLNIKRGNYRYLGSGSGRIVFDLEDGFVVKVAKNRKGIAQNQAEYKISLDDDSGLLAKASSISERSSMLIMEKAKKIQGISYVWKYFHVRNNRELYQINELREVCKKFNLEIKDFGRSVNWGEINGKPIIVDYCFTQQVRRRFYMSFADHIFERLRQ